MATVRFSINPQDAIESVVIATGAATVTKSIELTVDQAALVADASRTPNPRAIIRKEVITSLLTLIARLQKDDTTLNE
jgi:hypothetical protein